MLCVRLKSRWSIRWFDVVYNLCFSCEWLMDRFDGHCHVAVVRHQCCTELHFCTFTVTRPSYSAELHLARSISRWTDWWHIGVVWSRSQGRSSYARRLRQVEKVPGIATMVRIYLEKKKYYGTVLSESGSYLGWAGLGRERRSKK